MVLKGKSPKVSGLKKDFWGQECVNRSLKGEWEKEGRDFSE